MSIADVYLALIAIWVLALLTPGPNVLLVAGLALNSGRAAAFAVAGVLLGTLLWGLAGLFGLFWLLEQLPQVATAVKLVGSAYLAYFGLRIIWQNWRAGGDLLAATEPRELPPLRAFSVGLATAIGNPKSLMFISSLFAVSHLAEQPLAVGLGGVALMLAFSTSYYAAFGTVLTRLGNAGRKSRLARAAGISIGLAMVAFGARMAFAR